MTSYTKFYVLTQTLLLLPVEWDENDLLFTKRLQMMTNVITYSYAKTIMSSIEIYGKEFGDWYSIPTSKIHWRCRAHLL